MAGHAGGLGAEGRDGGRGDRGAGAGDAVAAPDRPDAPGPAGRERGVDRRSPGEPLPVSPPGQPGQVCPVRKPVVPEPGVRRGRRGPARAFRAPRGHLPGTNYGTQAAAGRETPSPGFGRAAPEERTVNAAPMLWLESALGWVAHASWQAAILGLIVLGVSRIPRSYLPAGWRSGLWLVVFARREI